MLSLARSSSSATARMSTATAAQWSTLLECSGCCETVDSAKEAVFACPKAASAPEVDHVLAPVAIDFRGGVDALSFFCGGVDGLCAGVGLGFFCGGVDGLLCALDARTTAAACQWLPVPSL